MKHPDSQFTSACCPDQNDKRDREALCLARFAGTLGLDVPTAVDMGIIRDGDNLPPDPNRFFELDKDAWPDGIDSLLPLPIRQ